MKFIADDMLGKLAKWLRIMGYDVLYHQGISDGELLRLGAAEKRIILTRDTKLVERCREGECVLIRSVLLDEQLKQVVTELDLDVAKSLLARCLICNCEVLPVSKEDVRVHVLPYIFETQEDFHRCPMCNRVYWKGTHYYRIIEKLSKIQAEI